MENKKSVIAIIVVAALGYFVDIYDLILFSIVRIASLKSLNVPDGQLLDTGVLLLDMQMGGMLLGGIIWGILGDKRGRISVLFGSIFLYSLANILNGFVQNIEMYALLRFVAGIGLAGELGAGITLVSEVMAKTKRGYGTMIVASIGVMGAVAAALIVELTEWRTSYIIGGIMGFTILVLRFGVYESGMYNSIKEASNVGRGQFVKLFTDKGRFLKYMYCILIGLPLWFVVGILITFSPEFGKAFGITEPVSAGKAVMYCYIGLVIGDILSGSLSQLWKSRKKTLYYFLGATLACVCIYLFLNSYGVYYFYTICVLTGTAVGYWAIFVTNASEQFGINLRSTVTTTVPNFVRGSVIPLTLIFQALKPLMGIKYAAFAIGIVTITIAFWAASKLEETFHKDLNYTEVT
ncbi:MAG: MFS transporter [Ignavibacteria bacterium]|nr:MFS transporter [Ignavibacteria bacterium]